MESKVNERKCPKCGHAENDIRRRGSDRFSSFCIYGCGCECVFAPREAERHEFKPGMSSNLCGVATKDWIACSRPREAEVHIGRDTKKMPPTEYQKPFKVKKVKEYSGDVQQMSSPHKEVGFWFDRYAVVDAKGKELTRFSEKADAKMVVDAMNKRK